MAGLQLKDLRPISPMHTGFSLAFRNEAAMFPGAQGRLLPFLPSPDRSGKGTYQKWGKETFLLDASDRPAGGQFARAPGAVYTRDTAKSLSTGTFQTEEYGLEEALDKKKKEKAQAPLQLERTYTEIATVKLMAAAEKRVLTMLDDTTNLTQNTTLSGTSQWSDYNNSDPIVKIQTGLQTIRTGALSGAGVNPSGLYDVVALCNDQVWDKLKFHPNIKQNLPTNVHQIVTPADMMRFFGIDELIVHAGFENTAKEGQTVTVGRLYTDAFCMFLRPKSPAPDTFATGFVIVLDDLGVEVYEEKTTNSEVYRLSEDKDEILVSALGAYLILDTLA